MFRFSIRELMLVTLVVALSVGWAIDHWRPNNPCLKAELRNMTMEEALKLLGYEVEQEWWHVRVLRNEQRPWINNENQSPKTTLIMGGTDPPDSP